MCLNRFFKHREEISYLTKYCSPGIMVFFSGSHDSQAEAKKRACLQSTEEAEIQTEDFWLHVTQF